MERNDAEIHTAVKSTPWTAARGIEGRSETVIEVKLWSGTLTLPGSAPQLPAPSSDKMAEAKTRRVLVMIGPFYRGALFELVSPSKGQGAVATEGAE